MPKPVVERMDASDALVRVAMLHFPGLIRTSREPVPMPEGQPPIQCELEMDLNPMPIDADPEMLHRALSNLVLNAMDAMPDGGTLTLAVKACGDKVEIRVADTGMGMTPEECERLFTPYYTTKEHGTGLGLAIVQSVVADHAGTIAVESRAGGGAAFVISLPRAGAEG